MCTCSVHVVHSGIFVYNAISFNWKCSALCAIQYLICVHVRTCICTYSVMSISLNLFLYTYHSLRLLSVSVILCSLGPHLCVIPLPTAAAVEGSAVG